MPFGCFQDCGPRFCGPRFPRLLGKTQRLCVFAFGRPLSARRAKWGVDAKWGRFPICPEMSRFVPVCPLLSFLGPRTRTNRDKTGHFGTNGETPPFSIYPHLALLKLSAIRVLHSLTFRTGPGFLLPAASEQDRFLALPAGVVS